jgi:AcrR family transcriptional regulator
MTIPVVDAWAVTDPATPWGELAPEAKHERILCAAGYVFTHDGLDAPMPAVAAVAGAGVGSLYRQFPSKQELLAALVIRRLEQIQAAAEQALASDGSQWEALTSMLWSIVEQQWADDFMGQAWWMVSEHPDVVVSHALTADALELLLEGARREGRLRADATVMDLQLLFTATRAAKQVEPEAWQRMLTLLIDALAAR